MDVGVGGLHRAKEGVLWPLLQLLLAQEPPNVVGEARFWRSYAWKGGREEALAHLMSGLGSASISHSRCSRLPSCLEDGLRKKAGSMPPGTLQKHIVHIILLIKTIKTHFSGSFGSFIDRRTWFVFSPCLKKIQLKLW